ncbi:MAG: hypothetical protein DRR42_02935, partial [Gammaproteobacteria bacterium]
DNFSYQLIDSNGALSEEKLAVVSVTGVNESITGSASNDTLNGTVYADTINGLTGDDTLFGDIGDDLFVFSIGDGADIITDFLAGEGSDDRIDLTAFGFAPEHDVLAMVSQVGADAIVNLGGGDQITLIGVNTDYLHVDDFLL